MRASPVLPPDLLSRKFRVALGISAANECCTGTLVTVGVRTGVQEWVSFWWGRPYQWSGFSTVTSSPGNILIPIRSKSLLSLPSNKITQTTQVKSFQPIKSLLNCIQVNTLIRTFQVWAELTLVLQRLYLSVLICTHPISHLHLASSSSPSAWPIRSLRQLESSALNTDDMVLSEQYFLNTET